MVSNSLIQQILENTIHSIIISDHAPVSLTLNIPAQKKISTRWRFNNSLLEDPNFTTLIRREWASFLEMNDSPEISPSTLWESGKAVMRGIIISYSSHKKKQQQQLENTLEQKIKLLSNPQFTAPSEEVQTELKQLRTQLDSIINKKTQFCIQQLKYDQFHLSNKAGKYLANMLQYKKDKSLIPSILDTSGKTTQDPQEINNSFRHFYSSLYTNGTQPLQSEIDSFLNNLDLPSLTTEQANFLEQSITPEELIKALQSMQNNKSPGPDGLPAEFYKHFWDILSPTFNKLLTEIQTTCTIPTHMNTALITVFLKPNKDPTHPSSYRPLSLINTDLKIITKTLTTRIETVMHSLIHPDQTGFIKNRNAKDNIRRLFNLISIAQGQSQKTIVASLDAEKAFDKVNWTFLFTTLRKFGFGESFIQWITTLYTSPRAAVITNGITSPSFTLHQGTRQGCPLSPSLFAIFIEPLAAAIRQNNKIKGIQVNNSQHKISLYADDLLLYLQTPSQSLNEAFNVINKFSKVSHYKINWNKSTILPLLGDDVDSAAHDPSLPLNTGNIKYLGISISPRLSELYNLNYASLLKKIEDDYKRWNKLPLTLIGRIATIKMKILPQINYLFSMIPITPTDYWFKKLNSLTTHFYWKNKKPRIALTTLQNAKHLGGLEAPNFMHYYLANQLQYLYKWTQQQTHSDPWLDLEQYLCSPNSIADLPFLPQSIKKLDFYHNITIATTLSAWWKTNKITKSPQAPCRFTPIWHNPDLRLYNKPIHFPKWQQNGITHLHHVFENHKFMSFPSIVQKFGIGRDQFLHYQQLKFLIQSKITLTNTLQPSKISYKLLEIGNHPRKLISKLYSLITSSNPTITLPKGKWESDLMLSSDPDFWTQICRNTFSMTTNTNLQLIQYKTIHRIHITQSKLFKMKLSDTDICSQCTSGSTDTYLHATWLCQPVHSLWTTLTNTLSSILDCRVPLSPALCLLGDTSETSIPSKYKTPVLVSLAIAKKIIFQNWKSKSSCHFSHWTNLITEFILTEETIAHKKNNISAFKKTWNPLITFLQIQQLM